MRLVTQVAGALVVTPQVQELVVLEGIQVVEEQGLLWTTQLPPERVAAEAAAQPLHLWLGQRFYSQAALAVVA
jgi:hypothetical protein